MPNHSNIHWWQSAVIYQIYPRSYKDTTGNGVGDIPGIVEKLDYLSSTLGVDAIWISPFYPSPMADFGYDVSDYTDIHPLFGTLSDFDLLVEEAQRKGLRVIIDYVPNHSSNQHPWFIESRSSKINPRRDWYIWRDPKSDGSPPNNWLSVFGGSAWEYDSLTGQYYLHSFLKEQPDLNWRNPQVKEAMFNVIRFWLDRGVDGFRIDVAHFIMKDPRYRDNPTNNQNNLFIHKPTGAYDSQIHIYDKGHKDVHQIYKEFRKLLDTYIPDRDVVSIGEIHIFDYGEWVRYYGENLDEIHLPFNFSLLKASWNAREVLKTVDDLEANLPPGAWSNYVLGNHDESRIATRIGVEQTRLAAMLLLTLRGTPTLYYGDEIGMEDQNIPKEIQQDPWGKRVPGLGRDPNRTPMQWNNEPNAGFSPPEVRELWLPISEQYNKVNISRQLKEESSLLNLYQKLLKLRQDSSSLHSGAYHPINDLNSECFIYVRSDEGDKSYLIILNFSGSEQAVNPTNFRELKIILSTHLDRTGSVNPFNISLRPHEGLILERVSDR